MILRRILSAVLLSVSGSLLFAVPGDPDHVMARLWMNTAIRLLSESNPELQDFEDGVAALTAAEEFGDQGPDARYLWAKIYLDGRMPAEGVPLRRAFESAGRSLEYDISENDQVKIPFEERAVLYGTLALRLRAYSDYLDRYDQWPRGHRNDVRLLYAAARSALYLGLNERCAELASRGEAVSRPSDDLAVFGTGAKEPKPAFRSLAVVAGDKDAIDTLESAWRRWGDSMGRALEPWILSGRIDGENLAKIRSIAGADIREIIERFEGPPFPGDTNGDLTLARRLEDEMSITEQIGNFTGTLQADNDYDGYVEEQIRFVNGRADFRRIDGDQDGRYEWEILYRDDLPAQVRHDDGSLVINYADGAYPEVMSIVSREPNIRAEGSFSPGAFLWDPAGGDPLFGNLRPPEWTDGNLWTKMNRIVVRVDSTETLESGEAVTWLHQGYPVRAVETRFTSGDTSEPLWVRELIYDDGVITAGRRSFSRQSGSERIWEIYERYERGKLVGIAWDPGMSGTPTYLKDWALGTYLGIQVWNIDSDGWMDARRFLSSGNSVSAAELLVTEAQARDLLPWAAGSWYPWE